MVNTGILALANVAGIFLVYDTSGAGAMFTIRGGGNATQEMVDPNGVYSVTAGTASSTNIYWNAGASRYELQNNRGATLTYHIYLLV